MVDQRSWDEFRDAGLLWFVNMILHALGWAICVDIGDDGHIFSAYPARVKFRGFATEINDEGYKKVAKYLKKNVDSICDDAMEG